MGGTSIIRFADVLLLLFGGVKNGVWESWRRSSGWANGTSSRGVLGVWKEWEDFSRVLGFTGLLFWVLVWVGNLGLGTKLWGRDGGGGDDAWLGFLPQVGEWDICTLNRFLLLREK